MPRFVTFQQLSPDEGSVTLEVNYKGRDKPGHNLTVCAHGSLRKNMSNTNALTEFFEIYLMLGAEKFAVYNHSGSSHLKPLVDYYVDKGVLDFFNLSIPSGVHNPNQGQMVIIQDCIHRYMYQTKYIAMLDFDEFFLPNTYTNIVSMLDDQPKYKHCSQFQLRKFMFGKNLPPLQNSSFNASMMASLITRGTKPSGPKFIIRPSHMAQGDVHRMKTLPGYRGCTIPLDDGYIHHYREVVEVNAHHAANPTTDKTAFRFLDLLIPRLKKLFPVFSRSVPE